jgi:HSP20 family protein
MTDRFKNWLDSIPREEARLCPTTCWEPAVDIYQTPDGWLIKFDLAGVRPEDIRVSVRGRRLSVAGTRRDQMQEAGARYYRMEISYNSFQRTIELPEEVDSGRVGSEFRDGMLLVKLYERKSR